MVSKLLFGTIQSQFPKYEALAAENEQEIKALILFQPIGMKRLFVGNGLTFIMIILGKGSWGFPKNYFRQGKISSRTEPAAF